LVACNYTQWCGGENMLSCDAFLMSLGNDFVDIGLVLYGSESNI